MHYAENVFSCDGLSYHVRSLVRDIWLQLYSECMFYVEKRKREITELKGVFRS